MPIYEYRCENCGHELEAIQKISDAPLRDCPQCERETLKKQISAAAFRLKGGGWYETDFKDSKKKKNVLDSTTSSSSASESSSSTNSDGEKTTKTATEKSDETKKTTTSPASEAKK